MRTCTISGPNFIFSWDYTAQKSCRCVLPPFLFFMCHSSTLQLGPQYLGLMRYGLPIQRGLEVASVSYNLSGEILDKKTKVEMVTLCRGYLPTFLTDYLMLTCSPYRWHTINMRSHYTDPSVHVPRLPLLCSIASTFLLHLHLLLFLLGLYSVYALVLSDRCLSR